MKHMISICIVALFALSAICIPQSFSTQSEIAHEAVFTEIFSAKVGNGADEIAYAEYDSSLFGPNDMSIDKNGTICLLDSQNKRMLLISDGEIKEKITFDFCEIPVRGLRNNGNYYITDLVYDVVYEADANGKLLNKYPLPDDVTTKFSHKLYSSNDGKLIFISSGPDVGYVSYVLSKETGKFIREDELFKFVRQTNKRTVTKDGVTWNIVLPNEDFGMDFIDSDNKGNAITFVLEPYAYSIRKYNTKGDLLGYACVPKEKVKAFSSSDNTTCVDKDGNIYYFSSEADAFRIYKVTLGDNYTFAHR
ncbi:MAG: hypothetical protein RRY79_00340 [Clostridia bacterium]